MNTQKTFIHSFSSILPQSVYPQDRLIEWTLGAHSKAEILNGGRINTALLGRFAVKNSVISKRFSECSDVSTNWNEGEIYRLTPETPSGLDIKKKGEFFAEKSIARIKECYETKSFPDHFIHVTCTGYVSPSPPQTFFSTQDNAPTITHAYHMGCYASLPAVRIARALAEKNESVDIFHNEICSLHLDLKRHGPEQIVVQTLFADGHIQYRVDTEEKGFRILEIQEKIIPDSLEDMSWAPSSHGMEMNLSRKVPMKVEENIFSFVKELVSKQKRDISSLIQDSIFAIHPGGPRIIEAIQTSLKLRDDQILESKRVLFERGNMSSATLPHVWLEVLKGQYPPGTLIVSLAFGPGLTVFGGLFEVV